ncbi:MAG TPA: F0F1 ATP synthase subunit epsilon [Phycisphaerales bacterium]|nr:F0F1 ATP synthase subunit epsilon [Phycisphaerales bacterium]HMP37545.1 F0F1 ATP synthase subunit epsilon [Phycisphaerales bacterium]
MASPFRCSIVTPTESVLDHPASYVSFPAWDGQKGVMPGQSPFLSKLGIGPMRVDFPGGGTRSYLIEGGFAQMQGNVLSILANHATPAETIAVTDAEAELTRALSETATGAERETLNRRQQVARARVALAKAVQARGI